MPGIVDLAKSELGLPAQIGFPAGVDGVLNKTDDPAFATAVGLMFWGADDQLKSLSRKRRLSSFVGFSKSLKWLKTLLP
jgi:cell division protein FtsA